MLKLRHRSGLPIHIQLKAQLAHLVDAGHWPVGAQLPTVRRLAGSLRVNRNTVARVFTELGREGYLSCERGRGTFVARRKRRGGDGKTRELLLVVDEAMGRVRRLGFSPLDFSAALYARAHGGSGPRGSRRVPVLFLEGSRSRLSRFSSELTEALPLRIDELQTKELARVVRRNPRALRKYRLAVTTYLHLQEVRRLLAQSALEVVGLPVVASLDTVARLAAVPAGARVAVACGDRGGTEGMRFSLRGAGLSQLRLTPVPGEALSRFRRMLKKASVVVCSSRVARRLRALRPRRAELLVDDGRLDRAGIEWLRRKVVALEIAKSR